MPRLLLTAALPGERAPVLARLRQRARIAEHLLEGHLWGRQVALLDVGVGPRKAEWRTRKALESWPADAVLSFGTAGALADDLAVGDVLTAARLLGGPELSIVPGARPVTLASVARVVDDPTRRDDLARQGAHAVEMEAAGVLRGADGLPLSCLKVVSDHAGARHDVIRTHHRLRWLRFNLIAIHLVERRLVPVLRAFLATGSLSDHEGVPGEERRARVGRPAVR